MLPEDVFLIMIAGVFDYEATSIDVIGWVSHQCKPVLVNIIGVGCPADDHFHALHQLLILSFHHSLID